MGPDLAKPGWLPVSVAGKHLQLMEDCHLESLACHWTANRCCWPDVADEGSLAAVADEGSFAAGQLASGAAGVPAGWAAIVGCVPAVDHEAAVDHEHTVAPEPAVDPEPAGWLA